ncbi:MFS general substrate transporter [Hymenopellis radicata]|nr:MFS general substrate transporter [Hymenopellis radicata]
MYDGIIALVYAFGSGISPLVGGAFTQKASWRWFFYMNLPLCLIAIGLVTFLLNLKTPQSNVIAQIKGIDWLGNLFLMSSTSSCIIALTWAAFALSRVRIVPTLTRRRFLTCMSDYLYVYRGVRLALNDSCRPTWFQAVHGAGPIKSGLYALPLVGGIAPAAVLQGTVVTKTGRYRTVNFFAWSFMLIGLGFFISIKEDMHLGIVAAFEVVLGVGIGALFATMFTVLAPLQVKDNAAAMGLLTFSRQFSQAWGIAIGGTRLPSGVDISFALIPRISSMPEPLQSQVRSAFHDSLHRLWVILICIGGAGFLSLSLMRDIPLQSTTDERWGIVENNERNGFQVTDRIIEEEVTVGK